jgi:hypothetical protein
VALDRRTSASVGDPMTALDHIVDHHRREERIAQAIFDIIVTVLVVIGYCIYSSVF